MKLKIIEQKEIFEPDSFFSQCHASTILKHGKKLLCAWFAGTQEGHDDVRIYLSVNENGVWSAPEQMPFNLEVPCWNPVLFESDGIITLFFKAGKKITQWQTYCRTSADGGKTWTEARELVPGDVSGGRGPVKNKPIKLSDGRILAPASVETALRWDAFADISEDGGKSWKKSRKMPFDHLRAVGKGVIQPTFWESDGKIFALLRSSESRIMKSVSEDGINWSKCEETPLPNNNSGIDCVKLKNGEVLVVFNPIAENWGDRNIISCALTSDNAESFSEPIVLEKDADKKAEFSYPAVIADEKYVYITYTRYRKSIMFIKAETAE